MHFSFALSADHITYALATLHWLHILEQMEYKSRPADIQNALTEDVTSSQSEYTFHCQLKMWLFRKSCGLF